MGILKFGLFTQNRDKAPAARSLGYGSGVIAAGLSGRQEQGLTRKSV
jgi:hypothetical protein